MRISAKLTSIVMGGVLVLGMAGAAMAAPAIATGSVNVRSGPSTGYQRIDTLARGERVDVQECQGSWCYVIKSGPDGWVSANYLQRGQVRQQTVKPSVNFSFSFGNFQRPPRNNGGNGNGNHNGGWQGGNWNGGHGGGWNNNHH